MLPVSLQGRVELKKVVLIGDSIRSGYQPYVKKYLSGQAEIWGPKQNGGTSSNVVKNLDTWVIKQDPDIVHINAGLHDLQSLYFDSGPGNTVVPLDHYRDNVKTIIEFIRTRSKAFVIWATTTPVIYERAHQAHSKSADHDRYNEDVIDYNNAALKIASKYDVPVNDLYKLVWDSGPENLIGKDGVHFTDEGKRLQAARVGDFILNVIQNRLN